MLFHRHGKRATLSIGDGAYLNHDSIIVCVERVSVGKGCAIARDVQLLDGGDFYSIDGKMSSSPIEIGDDVWIGYRATVLKGTRAGPESVVAAGAVCGGEYSLKSLISGVSVKVIKRSVSLAR